MFNLETFAKFYSHNILILMLKSRESLPLNYGHTYPFTNMDMFDMFDMSAQSDQYNAVIYMFKYL